MKKSLELDVTDLGDILEGFVKKLDKMSEADLIDLAARLKPAAKHCKAIDDHVKAMVKEKLHDKEGSRLGSMFKAVLKIIPIDRFNQGNFKEKHLPIFLKFVETHDEPRITFEVR